jgi:hypothetical protein
VNAVSWFSPSFLLVVVVVVVVIKTSYNQTLSDERRARRNMGRLGVIQKR